jgi:heme/copper-type cytochrome/quinol oxidase subunit 2
MFEIMKSTGKVSILSLVSLEKTISQSSITNKLVLSNNQLSFLPTRIQHNTSLEIIWTLLPCVVLLLIAVPSFSLLYAIEDFNTIESSIKIIGNQWY